jgi:maltooligosyltrehalose trehalohydrolase
MGEEFASETPFLYFCDFEPELAAAVTRGRREEFGRFERFAAPEARESIPDPTDPATFLASKLDWDDPVLPRHAEFLRFCRHLLALRHREIVPRLPELRPGRAGFEPLGERGLRVAWPVAGGGQLTLLANLGDTPLQGLPRPEGRLLVSSEADEGAAIDAGRLPSWYTVWYLSVREPLRA